MMDLKEFMAAASEIENMPLSAVVKEQRVIRLLDLDRFLRAFATPVTVLDKINYPVVLALVDQKRIGILFVDLTTTFDAAREGMLTPKINIVKQARSENEPEDLWIVLVSEKPIMPVPPPDLINTAEQKKAENQGADRIFLLDFQNCLLFPDQGSVHYAKASIKI